MTLTDDIQVMANFGKVLKSLSIIGTIIKVVAGGFLVLQVITFFLNSKNGETLKIV